MKEDDTKWRSKGRGEGGDEKTSDDDILREESDFLKSLEEKKIKQIREGKKGKGREEREPGKHTRYFEEFH